MLECCHCLHYYREFHFETNTYVDDRPRCHFVEQFEGDLPPCEYPEINDDERDE